MVMDARPNVVILGGGLAGLAAAAALAPQGFHVTILESRNRLGGRASSFSDATSQQLVDACQHVSMGCCTNFDHFCRTFQIDSLLQPQPTLYFMTPDRRLSQFRADPIPAPFHLSRALLNAHYLTLTDKVRIGWGMLQLLRTPADADPPLLPWLKANRQNTRTIQRFWNVVLISALNDVVENLGLKYARKVFVDGFMKHRRGFEVQLPTVPLGTFYGDAMQAWFNSHGVELKLNQGVKQICFDGDRVSHLHLRDGSNLQADYYLSALPFDRLQALLPEAIQSSHFSYLQDFRVSPITSIHYWFDREVLTLPHVVLLDSIGQWIFNRGQSEQGEYYLQVVVSASEHLEPLGREKITAIILQELQTFIPFIRSATVLRSRVITEHKATFRAVPGIDSIRPLQATAIDRFFLAGDWTQTGWPATMEGAVRSGYLAAEAILRSRGEAVSLLQPDLK